MFNKKLIKNKVVAVMLIILGFSSLINGDGTFLLFTLIIGGPLFITKENWIL